MVEYDSGLKQGGAGLDTPYNPGFKRILLSQLVLSLIASTGVLLAVGAFQALSSCFGGFIAIVNASLIAWRKTRAAADRTMDARQSLLAVYRSVFERMFAVAILFVVGMAVFRLDELSIVIGFIAGQVGLIASLNGAGFITGYTSK